MQYQLHIAVRSENGNIYEELGSTHSTTLLPSLYDNLAVKLQGALQDDSTKVDPQDPEPKITLVRQETTHYESLDHFADCLKFLPSNTEPELA